jgi:hypothetical protein
LNRNIDSIKVHETKKKYCIDEKKTLMELNKKLQEGLATTPAPPGRSF